jgi:hypothetical protein
MSYGISSGYSLMKAHSKGKKQSSLLYAIGSHWQWSEYRTAAAASLGASPLAVVYFAK